MGILRKSIVVAAISAAAFAAPSKAFAQAGAQSDLAKIVAAKVVRIGAAESPPWYHQDVATGKWTGIAPDVAELVFSSIGVKVEYVPTDWASAAAGLQSGRFDVMGAFNATPERALAVDFTVPIYKESNGIVTLNPKPEMSTWKGMNTAAHVFATTSGTSTAQTVKWLLPNAKVTYLPNGSNVYLEMESGRVQGVIEGRARALAYIAAKKKGTYIVPKPEVDVVVNFGVRRSSVKELRDWLNVALNYYESNGALPAIRAKYLDEK
ncbi:hypothetical protein DBB29_01915 [Pandoraea cepalis]|uniref:Solute-binding protein family 3/N-terminal domain-containing protein n=1 Tax=Pandoraea cepalis TaxID=2508294 RepID=A0AAW7MI21_9BURK|nr:transporter substrate-binding domain-containing protein [Pandoraea cepalis]MDN4572273.1 hypothetical protein [Pandoraea cepalis]MDN4576880.1 hypothetical protein [Pandoraea cepalis]